MNTSRNLLLVLLILSAFTVNARENISGNKKASQPTSSTSNKYNKAATNCAAASARIDLDINNVRTTLLNGGDMWWDLSDAKYEVPKIDPPGSATSVHALFAGAIWVGGIDAGGNLKLAAQTYRQTGNDFWPGPLDNSGSVDATVCNAYDMFWKVNGTDIDAHIAKTPPISPSDIPRSILTWPGIGNPHAEGATGPINVNSYLAPFNDVDGDGIYDPTEGDYPVIDPDNEVYGDQMIFWVYNDKGNIHTETNGQAIGLQINATAFAFSTSDEVNNMTFYRYNLVNKASSDLLNTYMGQWVDPDLGCYQNDFVGCDVSRSLGIVYNSTPVDPDCGAPGYGANPPLVGIDYFQGPLDENGDEIGMSAFVYYDNDFTVKGNPSNAVHFYNYLSGFWKDGTPFTFGGDAYGGTTPYPYVFPNDPGDPTGWSECSENNTAADRRILQVSGPFTLKPGAVNNIVVGVVWVRPASQSGCAADFDVLRVADDKAQALFDNGFQLVNGPDAPTVKIRELDRELIISLVNEPGSNNINESYDEEDPFIVGFADNTFKFQGYILYQLRNAQVSASDLADPTQARIVAQTDIEDGVSRLINFYFDQNLGADVPVLEVAGNDLGIRNTFQITEDLFAAENRTLVNHKTYYYAAVAYAYNEFQKYEPLNPQAGGQKQPFLRGRKNFQVYSAIPHKHQPGRGGTVLRSDYGDGVVITRVDGKGNGGLELDLMDESIGEILASPQHFVGPVKYQPGKGPIDIKVYDPFLIKEADFEVRIIPDTPVLNDIVSQYARWELKINGSEVIMSNRDLSRINEQLIENYGISISIRQVLVPGIIDEVNAPYHPLDPTNGYLTSSIEFADPRKPWLTGVGDEGTFYFFNWIRSGQFKNGDMTGSNADVFKGFFNDYFEAFGFLATGDDVRFRDPFEDYENILEGTWAPYALANNLSQPGGELFTGAPHITHGPAFPRVTYNVPALTPHTTWNSRIPANTLNELHGVDVVLTNDRSKWTRSVVLELGEVNSFTQGNARKGQIRLHPSINSDGVPSKEIFFGANNLQQGQSYILIGSPGARIKYLGSGGDVFRPAGNTFTVDNISGSEVSWEIVDGTGKLYNASDIGKSWFPGYAINVETGERLNILFGEGSDLKDFNGADLIWNPTDDVLSPLANVSFNNVVWFGGKHYIYVHKSRYDEGNAIHEALYMNSSTADAVPTAVRNVHDDIMWVNMALKSPGYELLSFAEGIVPNDVKIRLRVKRPYEKFIVDSAPNDGYPMYSFSTRGMSATLEVTDTATTALDEIRVVPNPYYAYSSYEINQLDNRVKVTNLPDKCTISIYSINGDLIRKFNRDITEDTSTGESTERVNFDNSIEWNLRNTKNIPVASGVYFIHIQAPGIGEKVVKFFGVVRPIDLDSF